MDMHLDSPASPFVGKLPLPIGQHDRPVFAKTAHNFGDALQSTVRSRFGLDDTEEDGRLHLALLPVSRQVGIA
jgi:hypothetical protein